MLDLPTTYNLLSLSADEQMVLRCVMRQPKMQAAMIAQRVAMQHETVLTVLDQLVDQQMVIEQLHGGQLVYSAHFQGSGPRVRNMPQSILDLWQPSVETLLLENRLTRLISAETRTFLQNNAQIVHLQADQVYVWQGKRINQVALVQSGLFKQIRLLGNRQTTCSGYLRGGDWIGASEAIGAQENIETLTAITSCSLLTWPMEIFIKAIRASSELAIALSTMLSDQLQSCRQAKRGTVWAVDGLMWRDNAAAVAERLANAAANDGVRVVLWQVAENRARREQLGAISMMRLAHGTIWETMHGFELFVANAAREYPPSVYLDLVLTFLQSRYDIVVCDIGSVTMPWTQQLRGRANALLTVAREATTWDQCQSHWSDLLAYAGARQQRQAILFGGNSAESQNHLCLNTATDFDELRRRLALTHSIAIYVPSTQAVSTTIDNNTQVQSTLSFMGSTFGGATSSPADGVWNSDEHGLISEVVTVVRAFVSNRALEAHLDAVVHFATDLKVLMQQEAVAIDVDNQLILV